MELCGGTPWRLTCNGLLRRTANLSEDVGVPAFAGTTMELYGGTHMALDLYRTAAQIDAAVAGADFGAARERRADAVLAALRETRDAATLNARVEAARGMLAFLPAEAVEGPGGVFDAPSAPADFSVVAADGSHIDVNRHLPLRCALINIGGCRLTYGGAPDAEMFSRPRLRTSDAELFLQDPGSPSARQPVEGALMGLVRTVEEAVALADAVEAGGGLPTLALLDGTLVLWELGGELPPRGRYPDYVRERLLDDGLLAALDRIREVALRQAQGERERASPRSSFDFPQARTGPRGRGVVHQPAEQLGGG